MGIQDFIRNNWEIMTGILLGGSGVVAWIFRWFDARAARKDNVYAHSADYIKLMRVEINEVQDDMKSLKADVRAYREENAFLRTGINILIQQLEDAGFTPIWTPDEGSRGNPPPPSSRSRGFRP